MIKKAHWFLVTLADGSEFERRIPGNYIGASKGMEGAALCKALDQLQSDGLLERLSHIAADGDLSIASILQERPECAHIVLAQDPGHRQKNFFRSLKDLFGESARYKGFARRIGKFFMRCIKRAEEAHKEDTEKARTLRLETFTKLWQHAWNHYTTDKCPPSCPCNEFAADEDNATDEAQQHAVSQVLDAINERINEEEVEVVRGNVGNDEPTDLFTNSKKRKRTMKIWLDLNVPRDKAKAEALKTMMEAAVERVDEVLYAMNTCLVECSNWRRLVFLRKDRCYVSSYNARSMLAALLENLSRSEVVLRLYKRLNLGTVLPSDMLDALDAIDSKKQYYRRHKTGREYYARRKQVEVERAEYNIRCGEISKNRASKRKYKHISEKKLVPVSGKPGISWQTALQKR
jgi:hypothetical protein